MQRLEKPLPRPEAEHLTQVLGDLPEIISIEEVLRCQEERIKHTIFPELESLRENLAAQQKRCQVLAWSLLSLVLVAGAGLFYLFFNFVRG